jgi:hypothetical protein
VPTQFVSTIEELLGGNSSGSGLENREYGREGPLSWPRDTLHLRKLALTSPTIGGRSVGIVRSRTKATEFFSLIRSGINVLNITAVIDHIQADIQCNINNRPSRKRKMN